MRRYRWVRISVDFDSDPKVVRSGWEAAAVYQYLVRQNGARGWDGFIPAEFLCAEWISRGLGTPCDVTETSLQRLHDVGLLEKAEGGSVIAAWEKWRPESAAERTRRWRKRNQEVAETCDVTVTSPKRHRDAATISLLGSRSSDSGVDLDLTGVSVADRRRKPEVSDEATGVARHMLTCLRANDPEFAPKGGDQQAMDRWAVDIDLAIRVDRRDPGKLRALLDWVFVETPDTTDDQRFWRKNILSGRKLRQQYDTVRAAAVAQAGQAKAKARSAPKDMYTPYTGEQ